MSQDPSSSSLATPGRFRRLRTKVFEILKQKDSPRRIAMGAGIGIFVGFLPIMGIQMPVATLLALPLRGNIKAAVAAVWITNPLTFIPFYYSVYRFGRLLAPSRHVKWSEFESVLVHSQEWNWSDIQESLARLADMGADIMIPLWLGGMVLGIAFGAATYYVTFRAVNRLRARHAGTSSAGPA